jgi:hypothetical protein
METELKLNEQRRMDMRESSTQLAETAEKTTSIAVTVEGKLNLVCLYVE